ncbi:MAG TPA: hypothetical protein VIF83_06885 [Gemmatimonadaceae bacterium]
MMSSSAEDAAPPADPSRPRAIVAGHGSFPQGIVSAVGQITGYRDLFIALSNEGLSGEDIEARLRTYATEGGIDVFFTDLPAGSATMAVRRIMRDRPDVVLVTGANLATLLEFVFHADEPATEAARLAVEKGRASIATHGKT